MNRTNSFSSAATRGIAFLIIVSLTVTALPMPFTSASTIPSYPIGQDQPLSNAGVNVGYVVDCGSGGCSADPEIQTATSRAARYDQTGVETGEALVGYQFRLHRACDGQSTVAPFTLEYDYSYTFSADIPVALNGSAAHQVRARVTAGDVAPVAVVTTGGSGSGTLVNANVQVDTEITYEASLASHTTVQMTDNPQEDGESIGAVGTVEQGSLRIDFNDPLPPHFVSTGTTPAAFGGDGQEFAGYVTESPVRFTARAQDPVVNAAGQNIVQSCVREIAFTRNGAADVRQPGFYQGAVESGDFVGEGRHVTTITARDHQDNFVTKNLYFILDSIAPVTSVAPSPATPTGKAGWYKTTAPTWAVHCNRDPNGLGNQHTAPCGATHISQDGGATWILLGAGANFGRTALEGENVQVKVKSVDDALNANTPVTSVQIDVDTTNPLVSRLRNTTPDYAGAWHANATNITFKCDSDALSGCGLVETRADNGAWTDRKVYACAEGDDMKLQIQNGIEDVAGNRVSATTLFACDFTVPDPIGNLRITTPIYNNTDTNKLYSNVTPLFEWATGVDPVVNGSASGLRHYEVRFNGVTHFVTQPKFFLPSMKDGLNCLRVRAVDNVYNLGEFTSNLCITVDRVKPTVDWELPEPGTLYHNGVALTTAVSGIEPGWAVVVGDITTGATTVDPVPAGAAASLLDDVHLIQDLGLPIVPGPGAYENAPAMCNPEASSGYEARVDGNCVEPCENLNSGSATCLWDDMDDEQGDGTPRLNKRMMFVRAWDNAHNVNYSWRNYTQVDIAGIEAICGSVGCNQLLFGQSTIPDFVAYVVELRILNDPVYGQWTSIASIPLASQTTFTDSLHPTEVGKTYEYRVHVKASNNQIVKTSNVARIVATHVQGTLSEFA